VDLLIATVHRINARAERKITEPAAVVDAVFGLVVRVSLEVQFALIQQQCAVGGFGDG
jgi:hypothetical protein